MNIGICGKELADFTAEFNPNAMRVIKRRQDVSDVHDCLKKDLVLRRDRRRGLMAVPKVSFAVEWFDA